MNNLNSEQMGFLMDLLNLHAEGLSNDWFDNKEGRWKDETVGNEYIMTRDVQYQLFLMEENKSI